MANAEAARPKRPLGTGDKASLLTKVQTIRRNAAGAARSLAGRARVMAHVAKLREQVAELDPTETIAEQSNAILRACEQHDWDGLAAACEAFEDVVEEKSIAGPVRDHDVPVRAPDDPARAHIDAGRADAMPAIDGVAASVGGVTTVEQLGEAIRLARAGKRMTQQQAATTAGVGRRFVIELEHGKPTAEIAGVLAVCHAVGVTLTASLV